MKTEEKVEGKLETSAELTEQELENIVGGGGPGGGGGGYPPYPQPTCTPGPNRTC